MTTPEISNPSNPGPELWFPETSWGRIRPGDSGVTADQAAAFDALARAYHRPIVGWLQAALGRDDAADLAQDFFAWMLDSGFVSRADPGRGRFRAFLKAALRNYVRDSDRRERAEKRGGGRLVVSVEGDPDASWVPELPDESGRAPDDLMDDVWRAEVVGRALQKTEEVLEEEGKGVVFRVFRDYFLDPDEGADYASIAKRHGISRTDVSNYLMRAKRAYRDRVKEIVRDTVGTGGDLEAELLWLLGGDG